MALALTVHNSKQFRETLSSAGGRACCVQNKRAHDRIVCIYDEPFGGKQWPTTFVPYCIVCVCSSSTTVQSVLFHYVRCIEHSKWPNNTILSTTHAPHIYTDSVAWKSEKHVFHYVQSFNMYSQLQILYWDFFTCPIMSAIVVACASVRQTRHSMNVLTAVREGHTDGVHLRTFKHSRRNARRVHYSESLERNTRTRLLAYLNNTD